MSISALLTATGDAPVKPVAQRASQKNDDGITPYGPNAMDHGDKRFADVMSDIRDGDVTATGATVAQEPTDIALTDDAQTIAAKSTLPDQSGTKTDAHAEGPEHGVAPTGPDIRDTNNAVDRPQFASADMVAPGKSQGTTVSAPVPPAVGNAIASNTTLVTSNIASANSNGAVVIPTVEAGKHAQVTLPTLPATAPGRAVAAERSPVFSHGDASMPLSPQSDKVSQHAHAAGVGTQGMRPSQQHPNGTIAPGVDPMPWNTSPAPHRASQTAETLPRATPPDPTPAAHQQTMKQVPTGTAQLMAPVSPDRLIRSSEDKTTLKIDGALEFASVEGRSAPSALGPSPITKPEMARSIAAQMAEVIRHFPDKPVDLALNPQELGRLRMSIAAVEGSVTIQILAERQDTLDLIRRHIDLLSKDLSDLGFGSVNLTFGQGAGHDPADAQTGADQQTALTHADIPDLGDTPRPQHTLHLSDRTLDIRI